jgi:hypothetical protein
MEGLIRVKELGEMPPRNASYADMSKIRKIIFHGCFGDIIFISKESNEYQS